MPADGLTRHSVQLNYYYAPNPVRREMAQELRELNEERKNMTDTEAKKAIEMVEGTDLYEDNVLVVYLPECHESVAGIIAAV